MKDGCRARDDVAKRGGQGPPIGVTKISQDVQHNTAALALSFTGAFSFSPHDPGLLATRMRR